MLRKRTPFHSCNHCIFTGSRRNFALLTTRASLLAPSQPLAALLFPGSSHHLAFLNPFKCIIVCSCIFESFFVRYLMVVKLFVPWNFLPLHPRFYHFWDPTKSGHAPFIHEYSICKCIRNVACLCISRMHSINAIHFQAFWHIAPHKNWPLLALSMRVSSGQATAE